ncbi:MAG: hypothetical protein WC928_00520 [Patescibacteria group bacterium]
MNIIVNFSKIQDFFNLPPDVMLWRFMANFGWVIIAIMFLLVVKDFWLNYIRAKWFKNFKFILLAIDIPKGNIQSPQAVENLFTYLGGAHGTQSFFDKWFSGEFQLSFSFEIVSLEGYTQFLIRTPAHFRNLVESAVYSQYPDAEIVEVDDYCESFPRKFPDEEYDIWGSEFIHSAHYMYPIKLYREFEHRLGPEETVFRDPMAGLMELCSTLRRGENLMYQIIVIPTGFDWMNDGKDEIDKILGRKKETTFINKIIDLVVDIISDLSEIIYSLWGDVKDTSKDDFKKTSMMDLTPKQMKRIEGIDKKSSKLGFLCKIRVVYLAKKEVMNRSKAVGGFIGFIKQFSALDLNSFKPDLDVTATKTAYFNKDKRLIDKKNKMINNYIERDDWAGRTPFLLNIEELATIWHFPIEITANAPLVQKTTTKKYKPPANLSLEDTVLSSDSLKDELLQGDYTNKKKSKKRNNVSLEEDSLESFSDGNENIFSEDKEDDNLFEKDKNNLNVRSGKGSPPGNLPFS